MGDRFTGKKSEEKIEKGKLGDFHDIEELLSYLRGEISEHTSTHKDLWDEFDIKAKKAQSRPRKTNTYQLLDHLMYEHYRLEKLMDFFEHKLPNQAYYSQCEYYSGELKKLIDKYQMKIFESIFAQNSFVDENLEKIFIDSLSLGRNY